ncbi:MAG: zinc ribbon domain-containing protein [Anaerovoracaceae bacterium]
MYCTKCGKFLAGNDKFCSNCGAKVEESLAKSEQERIKVITPVDDFVWDVKEFPNSAPKKTGDINFDWGADELYKHSRYKKEEVAFFGKKQEPKAEPAIDLSEISFESLADTFRNTKSKGKPKDIHEERKNIEPEILQPSVSVMVEADGDVEKKYAPKEDLVSIFADEIQKEEIEVELPRETVTETETFDEGPIIHEPNMTPPDRVVIEEIFKAEPDEAPKKFETMVFEKDPVPQKVVIEEAPKVEPRRQATAATKAPAKKSFFANLFGWGNKKSEEPVVTDEAAIDYSNVSAEDFKNPKFPETENLEMKMNFESTIEPVKEEVVSDNEQNVADESLLAGIKEESKEIDKFYTFSKKNEEFQELLDKEYERLERKIDSGGLESDVAGFMDVHTGPMVEATSQIEEMAKSRELFFNDSEFFKDSNEDVLPQRAQKHRNFFGNGEISTPGDNSGSENDEEGPTLIESTESSDFCQIADTNCSENEDVLETETSENGILPEIVDNPEAGEPLDEAKEQSSTIDIPEEVAQVEKVIVTKLDLPPLEQMELTIDDEEDYGDEEPSDEEPEPSYEVASYIIEPSEAEELELTVEKPQEVHEPMEQKDLCVDGKSENNESEEIDTQPQKAQVIIDPAVWNEQNNTEKREVSEIEYIPEASSKVRFVIGTLILIIVIVIGLLVVRITMPNSVVALEMDKIANKAFSLVVKEEKSKETIISERSSLIDDKTGLIQLQIDKNYKENIKTIKYSKSAKYEKGKKYTFKELKNAKDIQKNEWYKDVNGKVHYFDEEIVGTIIAFESERVAFHKSQDDSVFAIVKAKSPLKQEILGEKNKGKSEKFDILEIGDIKVAGNYYYVWTIEDRNNKRIKKIYKMKAAGHKLLISESSNA